MIRKNRNPFYAIAFYAVFFLMLAGWILPSTAEETGPEFSAQLMNSTVMIDIDLSSLEIGQVGNEDGVLNDNRNYRRIRFFVIPGSTMEYCAGGNIDKAGMAFYDENGLFISGAPATRTLSLIQVPKGAAYAYACFRTGKEEGKPPTT